VLQITEKTLPQTQPRPVNNEDEDQDEEDEQETVEVKVAERIGEFEEVVAWGHGGQVEEGQDMFIRGVQEWIGFAEAMHGEDEDEEGKEGKKAS
jgi:ribonuclease H2 subunit C